MVSNAAVERRRYNWLAAKEEERHPPAHCGGKGDTPGLPPPHRTP
ncbi:hypothetical protein [Sodalis-like endosymbiont of Proechinophthirus fluctus]|nr:hypothetical protein [Sodalis-like endosymbiont of Proechinophthirus fluctus]